MVSDKKIDEIIETKIEDELNKRVEKEIEKKIKERIRQENTQDSFKSKHEASRRQFLKKIGIGAAGLGALTILPSASAFNIRTSNPLQYFGDNQNNPNFSIDPSGFLEASSLSSRDLLLTSKDLSSLGPSDKKDGSLYLHSGVSEITLADSSTTSAKGYYRWNESNSGWVQIAMDADKLDGFHANDFVRANGDTFSGPVRIDTDAAEDSLLELLTDKNAAVYPRLFLGGNSDNGFEIEHQTDNDITIVKHKTGGAYTERLKLSESGLKDVWFGGSDFEVFARFERSGSRICNVDNDGSDLRFNMYGGKFKIEDDDTQESVQFNPDDSRGPRWSFNGTDFGDFPKYSDDTNAPNDTMYFDTSDSNVEYKDPDGNIHNLG